MDASVEEIQQGLWRVSIAGITRVIRYRGGDRSFTQWDVTDAEGRHLWSAASLESAFRWIQARTGRPAEALFAQTLLEYSARTTSLQAPVAAESDHIEQRRLPTSG
jgi:hypothetical protein